MSAMSTPQQGTTYSSRLAALRERTKAMEADAVLVTLPADVRWASGFRTPEDARVLVTPNDAWLITDGRYTAQAAEESALETHIVNGEWLPMVVQASQGLRLAVQADHLTWSVARSLEEQLGQPAVAATDLLRSLRIVKSSDEIARLREAARLTDAAFAHVLTGPLRAGVREVDVALELERFVRQNGGEGMSFSTIVAGGHRSAMPHGTASERVIERGDLVTLDFGARLDGYHADMTRAVAIGPVAQPLRGWYDAVLEAQLAGLAALRPGVSGVDADLAAREVLARHGLAELFVHSLGHGTGLQIHEAPSLSQRSKDVLASGMVVTVEPGVYQPGTGGLRIEDMVLITEDGYERLSQSPKDYLEL